MRGHIVQRSKSTYSIKISTGKDLTTGKYKSQWFTVKGSKRDAEKRLSELLHQLDTGNYMKPGKQTVADYLTDWLQSVQGNLSPRTIEGYATIINRIKPTLGAIPLTQLKPDNLQKYYTHCLTTGRLNGQGGLNPLTVRHHHTLLHRALSNAMEWGLIIRNPADAVHPPPANSPEISIMSELEVQTFLKASRNTPYYALYYTILFTGMRRSEVLALRWSDVDLLLCQLSVSRSIHQLKDGSYIFRQPKSSKWFHSSQNSNPILPGSFFCNTISRAFVHPSAHCCTLMIKGSASDGIG